MARLQVNIEGNAKGLTDSLKESEKGLLKLGDGVDYVNKKFTLLKNSKFSFGLGDNPKLLASGLSIVSNETKKFTQSLGNANGVAMEFNRIIQDAPFGMMGIGNNLQQLVANFQTYSQSARTAAAETGKTVTTMTLLKGAIGSILSPVNLLTLGVAAATSAWTFYTMWSQKSNKANKESKSSIDDLVESLDNQSKVIVKAADSSGKEIAQLRVLYSITQNATLATNERKDAAQRLIKQYPELFKKIGEEGIMLGKAKDAYNQLTTSILATARAQAAYGMISEKSKEQLILDETNKKLQEEIDLTKKAVQQNKEKAKEINESIKPSTENAKVLIAAAESLERSTGLNEEIKKLQEQQTSNLLKRASLQEEINNLEQTAIKNQTDISNGFDNSSKEAKKTFDIIRDSLSFYDKKLYDINKKYDEIFKYTSDKDLLGLAKSNKEAEILRANMERIVETTNKLQSARLLPTGTPSNIPSSQGILNSAAGIKANIILSSDFSDKNLDKRLGRIVESGFRRGMSNILDNIDDLGSNFYEVFSNSFKLLANNINSIFKDVIATQLGNQMTKIFDSKDFQIGKLSNNISKGIVAGAGIAGSLISSMSSKTSAVGQGLGGALSGSAAGMAFGPWGAAIGGVVGAIAGIFGSKAARKQEKIQEEQLAEQKKQTALLEYQNARGWESSIIGQMTNQGLINGFSRDATGQLVAVVSGLDLKFILDRANNKR